MSPVPSTAQYVMVQCALQESALAQEAAAYKVQHPLTEQEPHMADWNGGIGMQQISWLEQQLQAAAEAQERVVVACHHPLGQGETLCPHSAYIVLYSGHYAGSKLPSASLVQHHRCDSCLHGRQACA